MKTLRWIWRMIWNPPLVWKNPDGTFSHTEKIGRLRGDYLTYWTLRPYWMHTFLCTRPPCGCRKRFGLWHTIWCMDHARVDLLDDDLTSTSTATQPKGE